MLQQWSKLLAPAAQDRITLLLNHVIGREPAAMARLAPQAGKTVLIHLAGWPALLPAAPDLRLRITPAGLWERLEADDPAQQDPDLPQAEPAQAHLRIALDASNPAAAALAALGGQRPQVQVQGEAQLAGEINWLIEHLRWDVADDLAAFTGPAVAHQLARFGQAAAQGLAVLARGAAVLRPGGAGRA
jgi:ubiquinone biosynthesis protein UbiJ